jgi:hypothetical protein
MHYTTRVGTARSRPVLLTSRNLHRLPYRESDDDGRLMLHVGSFLPHCPDCDDGMLQHAQVTHSSEHRICDGCGSHWHVYRMEYLLRRQNEDRVEIDLGCFRGGLREPDRAECIDGEGSPTHGALLSLLQPQHVVEAVARANGGVAHIDACWARRERFYAGQPQGARASQRELRSSALRRMP